MRRLRLAVAAVLLLAALATAGTVFGAPAKTIRGTPRANVLHGTPGADTIYGLGGNDRIYGGAGNDRLVGGPGNDLLVGGPGADILSCGPGNDTAAGDARDKAAKDCEHVRGIPPNGGGGGTTPPPPAACANGADDDGDGKVDYPNDPGCDSAADDDETDPPPPPPTIQAGIYCGFTEQGPGLCITTDGQNVTKFETSAIVDCTDGSRWTWGVTLSGRQVPIGTDSSFSYTFSGTLTSSSGTVTNIQESEFINGTFTPDGKATGTFAITSISYDYQGQHYQCTQGKVGWHTSKQ